MKRIVLCVAEKPSVAKAIAQFLSQKSTTAKGENVPGNMVKRMGMSRYNPVYEFDIKLKQGNYRMRVTSVLGHLMTLKFPESHNDWEKTDMMSLYTVPLEKVPEEGEGGVPVI